jgi:hypothetical protein
MCFSLREDGNYILLLPTCSVWRFFNNYAAWNWQFVPPSPQSFSSHFDGILAYADFNYRLTNFDSGSDSNWFPEGLSHAILKSIRMRAKYHLILAQYCVGIRYNLHDVSVAEFIY